VLNVAYDLHVRHSNTCCSWAGPSRCSAKKTFAGSAGPRGLIELEDELARVPRHVIEGQTPEGVLLLGESLGHGIRRLAGAS
jgi:hypothetical protein